MATITMTRTNGYLDLLAGAPAGLQKDQVLYFAVGTGNSAPVATQTKLDAEVYRNNFSGITPGSAGSGLITMSGLIDLAFANVAIAEIGLFASSTANIATAAVNTGVLIARALWSHSKVSTETVTLSFSITFS